MSLEKDEKPHHEYKRRPTTVYDAVAGRVGVNGFLTGRRPSKYRDTAKDSGVPLPPDEVLFRPKGAPLRYVEDDIYEADRRLQPGQRLPDSDLLKTIHAYAADFYGNPAVADGKTSFRSMDETALLALGILLEEAAGAVLGKTGDLAFVEGSDERANGKAEDEMYWHDGQWRKRALAKPEVEKMRTTARTQSKSGASRVKPEKDKSNNG